MADKKYISKIVKGGETLYIKDEEARQAIVGGMHFIGVSSTEITDGDNTGPWTIGGVTYIASGTPSSGQVLLNAGDVAIYGSAEFVWGGSPAAWREFGDMSVLGDLAYADTASATYTPQGSNAASAVSFTGQTDGDFVTGFNQSPVLPSFTEGAFDAGSLPSKAADSFTANTPTTLDLTKFSGGSKAADTFTQGSLPSKAADSFDAGSLPSLGNATTGNFNTDAEKSSYDAATETLTLSSASTSAAVTAQGTFDAGALPTFSEGAFDAGSLPTFSEGAFTAASLAAGFYSEGSAAAFQEGAFNAGSLPSKAADSFDAGTAPTLSTGKAITAVGTGEAAAQTFTGTQATITVTPDAGE